MTQLVEATVYKSMQEFERDAACRSQCKNLNVTQPVVVTARGCT